MERGGKDSKGQNEVKGSLGSPLYRKVEEDGISEVSEVKFHLCAKITNYNTGSFL